MFLQFSNTWIVCPNDDEPYLISLSSPLPNTIITPSEYNTVDATSQLTSLTPTTRLLTITPSANILQLKYSAELLQEEAAVETEKVKRQTVLATFSPNGEELFIGTNKGTVGIFQLSTLKFLFSHRHTSKTSGVLSVSSSRDSQFLLISYQDRTIKLFQRDANTLIFLRQFEEVINRLQWRRCCLSSNNEFIMAVTAEKSESRIYIWNRNAAETWSAFAPDFQELEDNTEYVESKLKEIMRLFVIVGLSVVPSDES